MPNPTDPKRIAAMMKVLKELALPPETIVGVASMITGEQVASPTVKEFFGGNPAVKISAALLALEEKIQTTKNPEQLALYAQAYDIIEDLRNGKWMTVELPNKKEVKKFYQDIRKDEKQRYDPKMIAAVHQMTTLVRELDAADGNTNYIISPGEARQKLVKMYQSGDKRVQEICDAYHYFATAGFSYTTEAYPWCARDIYDFYMDRPQATKNPAAYLEKQIKSQHPEDVRFSQINEALQTIDKQDGVRDRLFTATQKRHLETYLKEMNIPENVKDDVRNLIKNEPRITWGDSEKGKFFISSYDVEDYIKAHPPTSPLMELASGAATAGQALIQKASKAKKGGRE